MTTERVQLGLLPGTDVVIPSPQQEPIDEVLEERSSQVLLEMFEIVRRSTGQEARGCWNQLVRFLADCARVHPMPREDHPVADRLIPLANPFLSSFYEERVRRGCLPWDPLGVVFTHVGAGDEKMGQHLTPRPIVQYINDATVGASLKGGREQRGEEEEEVKPLYPSGQNFLTVMDPCCGTGRFLLDLVERYAPRFNIVLFGVELDLDLYRACLVNMRLWGADFLCPHFILRADALLCDLTPSSPNWCWAKRWSPPDWQETFRLVTPLEGRKGEAGEKEEMDREEAARWSCPSLFVPHVISTFFGERGTGGHRRDEELGYQCSLGRHDRHLHGHR